MNKGMTFAASLGLGAGIMYLIDPQRGERRRARLAAALADAADTLGDVSREALERGRALTGGWANLDQLEGASRSALERGRTMVAELGGGDVARSARRFAARAPLAALRDDIGALARDPRSFQPGWRNGRLRLRRRGWGETAADYWWAVAGVLAGAAAVAWYARSAPGRIDIRHFVMVDAPVERVFEIWSRLENFPRLMSAVREVRDLGGDRTHWVVGGPAGIPVEWDAVTTRFEPNRAIGWKTVEGALIEHRGTVRFERVRPDRTRLDIAMSYRPAGGALGESIATLLGSNPQQVLRDDLERFKAQLGPAHAAAGRSR